MCTSAVGRVPPPDTAAQGRPAKPPVLKTLRKNGPGIVRAHRRGMTVWSDTRFALRQLRKSPAFTLVVIRTLALCLGVNTAIFSVLDAVLLRDAPYPEPDRLALVVTASHGGSTENINPSQTGALFEAVRDHIAGVDVAANAGTGGVNFAVGDRPEYIQQQRVSAGSFRVLGHAPQNGREIRAREEGPAGAAGAVVWSTLEPRGL